MLRQKGIDSRKILLGVRPEHVTMAQPGDATAISCTIKVNEMMGSELHLHVEEDNGDKLIVRVPTVSLSDEQRRDMVYGHTMYVTFEGKVMHFFDVDSQTNLLV